MPHTYKLILATLAEIKLTLVPMMWSCGQVNDSSTNLPQSRFRLLELCYTTFVPCKIRTENYALVE